MGERACGCRKLSAGSSSIASSKKEIWAVEREDVIISSKLVPTVLMTNNHPISEDRFM